MLLYHSLQTITYTMKCYSTYTFFMVKVKV